MQFFTKTWNGNGWLSVQWENTFFKGKLWCHTAIFSFTKRNGELFWFGNALFGSSPGYRMGTAYAYYEAELFKVVGLV